MSSEQGEARPNATDRPAGRGRPRNAAATRAAILEAARHHFTRAGYDRVGVRDVAATAGVDPALVIRYFGSKEGLFRETMAHKLDAATLLVGGRAGLGERLTRYVLAKPPTDGFDPLLALLRSAPSEGPGRLLRQAIDEQFVRPLAGVLPGEAPELRAGVIVSLLLGLVVGRTVVRSAPVVEADADELVALVAPAIQALIDGGQDGDR